MSFIRHQNIAILLSLLASLPLLAQSNGDSFTQDAAPQVAPTANLVAATATIADGDVKVSFTVANGTATSWHHVYFNTDDSGSTGFIHSTNSEGGKGMDYLIEPNFLYHWNGGEDQRGWHWEKVVSVQGTISGNKVTYEFPSGALNLKPDARVSILIETMNDNYAVTLDTLPRTPGVWTIKASSGDQPGATSQNSASPTPVAAPDPQARERFKTINSYACYYGPAGAAQIEALSRRDAVIVETRNLLPGDVAAIKKKVGLWSRVI